jgi:tRNA/tmRNA/rRNA uracil-C5-methylase (TrmA/RlmC/RlmD family)
MKVLYGRDHYYETLLGLSFRIGAFSFFQTNTSAVESMLKDAFTLIPNERVKDLYDVYCGTGAIALSLSHLADKVTGIELSEDSVISARENAARNGITNADFICGDAFEVIKELPAPDLLVADPPRMGLHPKALKRVIEYNLSYILYISCNPKTFAENAAVLKSSGYRISVLRAYDNFPFTRHIELVALLRK